MFVGTNVPHRVRGGIRVSVGVTVEAGDSLMRQQRAAVGCRVELRLRKRRDQQTQSFELLWIQDLLKQFIEIAERHQFALGDVSEIRTGREINRGGKFREQMLRQVIVQVEARQIAADLLLCFVD